MGREFEDFTVESARASSRDRKRQRPKVISVNPGLRNLAAHIAHRARTAAAGVEKGEI